jgi:hypothetical protein
MPSEISNVVTEEAPSGGGSAKWHDNMSTKSQPVTSTNSRQMSKTLPNHFDTSSKESARLTGTSDKVDDVIAEDLPLHGERKL